MHIPKVYALLLYTSSESVYQTCLPNLPKPSLYRITDSKCLACLGFNDHVFQMLFVHKHIGYLRLKGTVSVEVEKAFPMGEGGRVAARVQATQLSWRHPSVFAA